MGIIFTIILGLLAAVIVYFVLAALAIPHLIVVLVALAVFALAVFGGPRVRL